MILLGLVGFVFIFFLVNITLNNENEYYVLKEAMKAAMLESIDVTCYMLPANGSLDSGGRPFTGNGCGGDVKISEQKFVENFTRRYAASVSSDASEYNIEFYDIMEKPPKATVVIEGKTSTYSLLEYDELGITNNLTGILEFDA